MRRLPAFLLLAALFIAAPSAHAAEPQWRAGGDLGLFFRDEAGGNRSVLLGLAPRASVQLHPHLRLAAGYLFAFDGAGEAIAAARTQHHRLDLRAEGLYQVRSARLVAGLGPALSLTHTTLVERGAAVVSTTIARPAVAAGAALEVDLGKLTLRTGVDLLASLGRSDLFFLLGAAYPLGGAR